MYLDLKVVHRVHGERENDLEVFQNGLSSRQVAHHSVVVDHLTLTGGVNRETMRWL